MVRAQRAGDGGKLAILREKEVKRIKDAFNHELVSFKNRGCLQS